MTSEAEVRYKLPHDDEGVELTEQYIIERYNIAGRELRKVVQFIKDYDGTYADPESAPSEEQQQRKQANKDRIKAYEDLKQWTKHKNTAQWRNYSVQVLGVFREESKTEIEKLKLEFDNMEQHSSENMTAEQHDQFNLNAASLKKKINSGEKEYEQLLYFYEKAMAAENTRLHNRTHATTPNPQINIVGSQPTSGAVPKNTTVIPKSNPQSYAMVASNAAANKPAPLWSAESNYSQTPSRTYSSNYRGRGSNRGNYRVMRRGVGSAHVPGKPIKHNLNEKFQSFNLSEKVTEAEMDTSVSDFNYQQVPSVTKNRNIANKLQSSETQRAESDTSNTNQVPLQPYIPPFQVLPQQQIPPQCQSQPQQVHTPQYQVTQPPFSSPFQVLPQQQVSPQYQIPPQPQQIPIQQVPFQQYQTSPQVQQGPPQPNYSIYGGAQYPGQTPGGYPPYPNYQPTSNVPYQANYPGPNYYNQPNAAFNIPMGGGQCPLNITVKPSIKARYAPYRGRSNNELSVYMTALVDHVITHLGPASAVGHYSIIAEILNNVGEVLTPFCKTIDPTNMTYQDFVATVKDNYAIVVHKDRINEVDQFLYSKMEHNESLAEFAARLKTLAKKAYPLRTEEEINAEKNIYKRFVTCMPEQIRVYIDRTINNARVSGGNYEKNWNNLKIMIQNVMRNMGEEKISRILKGEAPDCKKINQETTTKKPFFQNYKPKNVIAKMEEDGTMTYIQEVMDERESNLPPTNIQNFQATSQQIPSGFQNTQLQPLFNTNQNYQTNFPPLYKNNNNLSSPHYQINDSSYYGMYDPNIDLQPLGLNGTPPILNNIITNKNVPLENNTQLPLNMTSQYQQNNSFSPSPSQIQELVKKSKANVEERDRLTNTTRGMDICTVCAAVDHLAAECHLLMKECFFCKEVAHTRATCRKEIQVHPENAEWTCFEQNARLDVKSFFGFESTVEKLAMKQYSQNISKGKEIIEYFIEELKNDGITSLPIWQRVKKASIKRNSTSKEEEDYENSSSLSSEESQSETLVLGSSAANHSKKDKMKGNEDNFSKLDADYIKRCVGDLTPLQESRLVQLKKWVSQLQKGKLPSDTTLLRFLRARDYNLEKAREMLSQSLIWRKKNQVDKILSEYKVPQVIQDYFPGGWHFHDKDGRPLFMLRLGQMDVKGLIKSIGEEGLLKHTLHICEEGLKLAAEATNNLGRPITTWTLLVDLEGLNMRHLWRPGIKTLLKIIEIVENNYPETMSHVLIIRAPRVFPILWTLVSSFIDDHTRTKFLFYGGNDYQGGGGLIDFMPKDYIPDFLGGDCKRGSLSHSGLVPEILFNPLLTPHRGSLSYSGPAPDTENFCGSPVVDGGLVPKSLYLPGEEIDGGKVTLALSDQSIYHSVSLTKGQVHEVLLLIEDPGAVICWDFDVMKTDIMFSIIRTKTPIKNNKEPLSPTGALSMIDAVMGSDDLHRSAIEKTWREGHEYFMVEPQLICHDGESVQGSHVTSQMGTYILQWRYYEATIHSSPLDIIDSFTAHKAKIMYFTETLKSSDYKGSMSSLQSCQSGFSSLSSTTGKSMNSSCPSR